MKRTALAVTAGLVGLWLAYSLSQTRGAEQGKDAATRARTTRGALIAWRPSNDHALSGSVQDEQHAPIVGAEVCALCAACDPTSSETLACARTDTHGRFALTSLQPLAYRVVASAEGYASAAANQGRPIVVTQDAPPAVQIVLARAESEVSGSVLDATGGVVVGAEVRVVHWGTAPTLVTARSDADGRFKAFARPGEVSISALAAGYSSLTISRVAPARDVEVVLTPGGAIDGRVVSARDGRPVVGATVLAVLAMGSRALERSAVTDQYGEYALDGLEPGAYRVSASARGFRGAVPEPVIVVGVGHTTGQVTIEVAPAAEVEGRVIVKSQGRPCVDGSVALGPPSPPGARLAGSPTTTNQPPITADKAGRVVVQAQLDKDGIAHFDAVPAGHYEVSVSCRDHNWRAGPVRVEVGDQAVSGLVWEVEPGLGLALQVIDQRGDKVPFARAELVWPTLDQRIRSTTVATDIEGHYRHPSDLYPGKYRVHPGFGHTGSPVEFELRDGMGVVPVTLRLAGDGRLEAQVRTPDGKPVDGLTLLAYAIDPSKPQADAPTLTRSAAVFGANGAINAVPAGQGRYVIAPIAPGLYRWAVIDELNPTFAPDRDTFPQVRVRPGQHEQVSLVLDRGAVISGRVLDSEGAPVLDAWVHLDAEESGSGLAPMGGHALRQPASAKLTDGDGAFSFQRLLPAASFTLRAETPDGSGKAEQRSVRAGSDIVLTLKTPGSVQGVVESADGTPTDDFMLQWRTDGGRGQLVKFSHASGQLKLDKVCTGKLQLRVISSAGETGELELSLQPGQALRDVRLQLSAPQEPAHAAPPSPTVATAGPTL